MLWIGLVAGTLDITDNLIYNALRNVSPKMVFQFIASGLIGSNSFRLGAASVILGVVCHYTIAISWTAIFYILSRRWPVLVRRAVLGGSLYGGAVFLFMNYVVVPLSRVPHLTRRISFLAHLNAVLSVVVFIGLTIALLMRHSVPLPAAPSPG
jgi:uncharacterized membrane protein YagU involved in acid resistance